MKLFIAIDDTDNKESIGTGRLSRMLADMLEGEGLTEQSRVTRHQLLVHPAIPYTSHNSSACIDVVMKQSTQEEVADLARFFLQQHFHEGANPGLCIARQAAVPEELPSLGRRAQKEVIALDEAKSLADRLDVLTWWSGETGQGCIGAMSALGLRSTNNDGRYIALDGIREIGGMMTVGNILELTAVDRVATLEGDVLASDEVVDTQNWVRPILRDGIVILEVIPVDGHWRAPHKKNPKKKKHAN
jgi:hypothetical protein